MLISMAKQDKESYHHGNLREALIDQAEKDLESQGLSQLSLRALARKLGVSKNAPYRHIKDKQELIFLLIRRGFDLLYQFMMEEIDKNPKYPRVQSIGKGYIRFGLAHPQLYRLMFQAHDSIGSKEKETWFSDDKAFHLLTRMTDQQTGDSGTPLDSFVSWAFVHGVVSFLIDDLVDPGFFIPQDWSMDQFIDNLFKKDYLNG